MKNKLLPNARPYTVSQFFRILREGAWPAFSLLTRPSTLAQIPRMLDEGLYPALRMFIQAHNNREMARLMRDGVPITFVCSFARSGNTWMRYLISDVLLQNQGYETTTELPVDPGRIIPDYYAQFIVRRDTSVQTPGYLIKTHDLIPLVQKHVGGDAAVRKCKYLYLFRTPEDALVSFYHLYLREKYIRSNAGRNIDLFCLGELPGWIEHLTSYLDALDEGVDVYLVSYDELLKQTKVVLRDTLKWLGVPHTEALVEQADENMRFGKLKAVEAKTLGHRIPFFRRGTDGSGKLELKPETLAKIQEDTKQVFARANDRLARQKARSSGGASSPPFRGEADLRKGISAVRGR
jgi:hypothetical protein